MSPTPQQIQKIGQLTYDYTRKGPLFVTIIDNPFDLPEGWVMFQLYNNQTGSVVLVGGINPEGQVST